MVSGFSPGLLKVFLDGGDVVEDDEEMVIVEGEEGTEEKVKRKMDPVEVMVKALMKESFAGLKVAD